VLAYCVSVCVVWACTAPHTTIIHRNSILYAGPRMAWNTPAPQNPSNMILKV
jgi:hypothetical protein